MTTQRFDIEVADKVARSIRTEIQAIGAAARSTYGSVKAMRDEIGMSSRSSAASRDSATASRQAASATTAREKASYAAADAMRKEAAAAEALTAKYRAQAAAAQAQSQFNGLLGVAGAGAGGRAPKSARDSASVFESMEPTAAMRAAEAADKVGDSLEGMGKKAGMSQQNMMNLGFQLNDVFVSLASGQKPLTVFVQQGAQIGQIASQAGVGLGGMAAAAWSLLAPFLPIVLAVGAVVGAFALLNNQLNKGIKADELTKGLGLTKDEIKELEDVTITMGDSTMAVFQVVGGAIWDQIGGGVKKTWGYVTEFWNDTIKKTREVANWIIRNNLIAYATVSRTWRQLPAAFGEAFTLATNAALTAINDLLSKSTAGVNLFMTGINAVLIATGNGIRLPTFEAPQLDLLVNEHKGAISGIVDIYQEESARFANMDFVGMFGDAVADQAEKNARARLAKQAKEIIDDRSDTGSGRQARERKSEEEKRAEALGKVNAELDSSITLLGFYGPALERESRFQSINNALLEKNITLSETEQASIREKIRLIQEGERVQSALNKIEQDALGPRRDYEATTAALVIAQRDGIVTQAEATRQTNLAATALSDANNPLRAYNDNIRETTEGLALYGRELTIQQRAQQLMNEAIAAGVVSRDNAKREDFIGTARDENKQGEMRDVFQDIDPRERIADTNAYVLDNYTSLYAEIDRLRQEDLISEQEAAERKKNVDRAHLEARLETTSSVLGQLATLQTSKNREMQALGKAAAITQATIDGYRAVQAALAGPPGPPWSFAIAGATAAMTAVNVAKIAGVGFMSGGYTGNAPTTAVAGAVHGQEYVFDAAATKRLGIPALDALRSGRSLNPGPGNDNGKLGGTTVNVIPMPGVFVEERQTSTGEIELIARRVARDEAPKAVAADLQRNPNSATSKAVGQSFGLKRADR